MFDLRPLVSEMKKSVQKHYLGDGKYCRYLWQAEDGSRKMGNNEYGCADAANILYTIGEFERDPKRRADAVRALCDFQHEDGIFDEKSHHHIHCTAHCIAALELFDASPRLPLAGLEKYKTKEGLYSLLEGLRWVDSPWNNAHQGAGIFAAFVLTGNASEQWQDWYFDWLTEHTDKKYGIGYDGAIDKGVCTYPHHLNGWFHYLFNFVFAKRPIPYAKAAVDSCIEMYDNHEVFLPDFGRLAGFAEIDWIYTLNRASRQEGYRVEEAKERIRDFAKFYLGNLYATDYENNERWNDLHMLFGVSCAFAELQNALPGEVKTNYPLKLVLDRRPFI